MINKLIMPIIILIITIYNQIRYNIYKKGLETMNLFNYDSDSISNYDKKYHLLQNIKKNNTNNNISKEKIIINVHLIKKKIMIVLILMKIIWKPKEKIGI